MACANVWCEYYRDYEFLSCEKYKDPKRFCKEFIEEQD